ncbi:hypothetical protein OS493_035200 [Desmophyllum pertusum]|uniref:Uncharacterized protein n=1 Tax=Desmophyllum pertusum TaxID=174260 RepID=A0A9X0D6R0_9CNID|nr:hypothetical protein OS493_035200 [Desmophyllum pertusum]
MVQGGGKKDKQCEWRKKVQVAQMKRKEQAMRIKVQVNEEEVCQSRLPSKSLFEQGNYTPRLKKGRQSLPGHRPQSDRKVGDRTSDRYIPENKTARERPAGKVRNSLNAPHVTSCNLTQLATNAQKRWHLKGSIKNVQTGDHLYLSFYHAMVIKLNDVGKMQVNLNKCTKAELEMAILTSVKKRFGCQRKTWLSKDVHYHEGNYQASACHELTDEEVKVVESGYPKQFLHNQNFQYLVPMYNQSRPKSKDQNSKAMLEKDFEAYWHGHQDRKLSSDHLQARLREVEVS